jgi:hypothetical protein
VTSRRSFLVTAAASVIAAPAYAAGKFTKGRSVAPFPKKLGPGDYVWHPEISPSGPVVLVVSLPEQTMYVFRNGVRIGRSTVSTGAKGHRTPTGVFTVLQKRVDHESNIYKGAKMPHMQRLTWGGIAMHAGQLPGYPASHGCVRLPVDFAKKLYAVTTIGTTVIIADETPGSETTATPGMLFAAGAGAPSAPAAVVWEPEKAPTGPVSIILSAASRGAFVYRNGVEIGRAGVGGLEGISGSHAFSALATVDAEGRRDWLAITSIGGRAPDLKGLAGRLVVDPQVLANVRGLITAGTSLIVTDMPVDASTHSGSDFDIVTTR